jgi:hypothetical protein
MQVSAASSIIIVKIFRHGKPLANVLPTGLMKAR